MNWHLEDFLVMECIAPGLIFGQLDIVCENCNCPYVADYEDENQNGYLCPNCGLLNKPE